MSAPCCSASRVSLLFEAATALALTARFAAGYDEPLARAAYVGLFHPVSAFNNAGFGLYEDSLVRFAADPWICIPIAIAVIAGGLGFRCCSSCVASSGGRRAGACTRS